MPDDTKPWPRSQQLRVHEPHLAKRRHEPDAWQVPPQQAAQEANRAADADEMHLSTPGALRLHAHQPRQHDEHARRPGALRVRAAGCRKRRGERARAGDGAGRCEGDDEVRRSWTHQSRGHSTAGAHDAGVHARSTCRARAPGAARCIGPARSCAALRTRAATAACLPIRLPGMAAGAAHPSATAAASWARAPPACELQACSRQAIERDQGWRQWGARRLIQPRLQ